MNYLGDYTEDAILDFMWSSNDSNGASITRATNGTISVYKANSTTQSTAGITDTEDFDSLTGIHHVRIDLSSDAFYATANDYMVVLSAATIDGQTVNAVLALFSIQNRYMRGTNGANTTTPPTAAAIRAEIDTNSTQLAAIVADTNELQTDDYPTTLAAITAYVDELEMRLTAVRAGYLDNLTNLDASVSSRLATAGYTAPDNASISAILADTDELQIDDVPGLISTLRGADSDTLKTLSDQIDGVGGGGGDATEAKQDIIIAYVDELENRLTAVRAGYLDNLTNLDAAISSIPGAAAGAIEVTDLLIDDGSNPIEGAEVWITTDSGGSNQVWYGVTNAAGYPKDVGDANPWLDAGTYYVWVQKVNYSFTNPTSKAVS